MNRVRVVGMVACSIFIASCASGSGSAAAGNLPPAPVSITEEESTLATPTGSIAGTLELPAARFPVPIVLIIAGSGPTDRNGNSPALPGANNSLKMIADGLAARGIATLRYDKRGIGGSRASAASESDLRFTHFIEDAKEWVKLLDADARFSTITIAGHSEGSLIGMIAAREANADGYVSIAGVGRKAPEVLTEQLSGQLAPDVLANVNNIMAKIEKGEKPDSVPPFLNALFRPSVHPYLTSWFVYNPPDEIAKLAIPVLILQGTTDLQVKVEDANRLSAANPRAKLVVIDGMNHVLKIASGPIASQMPSYSDSTIVVVPRLIDEIASLVKALPAPRRTSDMGLGIDKLKHFLMAGFVESVGFAGLRAGGADRDAAIVGATAGTAAVSVAKELHDRRSGGPFSFGDLLWDGLGAAAAFLVLRRTHP